MGSVGSAGTSIDQLALSPDGRWLAASIGTHSHPAFRDTTLPHVLVYDATGEDAEARRGPGHVIGGPPVKGREPGMTMPSAWDVTELGWVSATQFLALSR